MIPEALPAGRAHKPRSSYPPDRCRCRKRTSLLLPPVSRSSHCHSASSFYWYPSSCRSPFLHLECVFHWELNASRGRRPAFSYHLGERCFFEAVDRDTCPRCGQIRLSPVFAC